MNRYHNAKRLMPSVYDQFGPESSSMAMAPLSLRGSHSEQGLTPHWTHESHMIPQMGRALQHRDAPSINEEVMKQYILLLVESVVFLKKAMWMILFLLIILSLAVLKLLPGGGFQL